MTVVVFGAGGRGALLLQWRLEKVSRIMVAATLVRMAVALCSQCHSVAILFVAAAVETARSHHFFNLGGSHGQCGVIFALTALVASSAARRPLSDIMSLAPPDGKFLTGEICGSSVWLDVTGLGLNFTAYPLTHGISQRSRKHCCNSLCGQWKAPGQSLFG